MKVLQLQAARGSLRKQSPSWSARLHDTSHISVLLKPLVSLCLKLLNIKKIIELTQQCKDRFQYLWKWQKTEKILYQSFYFTP